MQNHRGFLVVRLTVNADANVFFVVVRIVVNDDDDFFFRFRIYLHF